MYKRRCIAKIKTKNKKNGPLVYPCASNTSSHIHPRTCANSSTSLNNNIRAPSRSAMSRSFFSRGQAPTTLYPSMNRTGSSRMEYLPSCIPTSSSLMRPLPPYKVSDFFRRKRVRSSGFEAVESFSEAVCTSLSC